MAYSSSDLSSVESAIVALAAGSRVESVTLEGKTIQYGRTDLQKLESLRGRIKTELASTTTNCIVITTSKGL